MTVCRSCRPAGTRTVIVSRWNDSLNLDMHGKALSFHLLTMTVRVPAGLELRHTVIPSAARDLQTDQRRDPSLRSG